MFDSEIKNIFLSICYTEAGENFEKSTACDLLEKDVLDLLW